MHAAHHRRIPHAGVGKSFNLVASRVSSASISAGQGPPYEKHLPRSVGRAQARLTSCIATLPSGDSDFASRWRRIKKTFSKQIPATEHRSATRQRRGERGIWQRRYWEHLIRDDTDYRNHIDYIHYNPVKHGLVQRAADWPHSSLHRHIQRGLLPPDWSAPP